MSLARVPILVAGLLLLPTLASAQVVIQGEVSVQQAQTVPAPPAYPVVQPGYVVAPPPQPQCPPGSLLAPNRWGQMVCMAQVTRHRIHGGLVGGGIGLFAGGYVLEVFTTLFSGIVGAFDVTRTGYTSEQLSNYVSWGFIPILGPWVQMGYVPPFADAGLYAWLAFEGLLQAGGITMMVFGFIGEDYTDYQPIAGVDLHLRPMLSASTQGVTATLNF